MKENKVLKLPDLDRALHNPASVFTDPEQVLAHNMLSKQQKIEILQRWEYDASEISVATEEGMVGPSDDLLRHIIMALDKATGGTANLSSAAPIKQHGISQLSMKAKS